MNKIQSYYLVILMLFAFNHCFSQEKETVDYKNGFGIYPPLPGILVLDYERFFNSYADKTVWSAGLSLGYGYDAGRYELDFIKGIDELFLDPVSFEVKYDIAINPFVRYYIGSPDKKFRQAIMLKPSLVIINIENEKNYIFPSYELHLMGIYSKNRFFVSVSLGVKHFLKYDQIESKHEVTYFPAFKFNADNPNEKAKRWLPATDIIVGYRF